MGWAEHRASGWFARSAGVLGSPVVSDGCEVDVDYRESRPTQIGLRHVKSSKAGTSQRPPFVGVEGFGRHAQGLVYAPIPCNASSWPA